LKKVNKKRKLQPLFHPSRAVKHTVQVLLSLKKILCLDSKVTMNTFQEVEEAEVEEAEGVIKEVKEVVKEEVEEVSRICR